MKVCTKCDEEYEPYGQRSSLCRECKRVYDREYHANRSVEQKRNKQVTQTKRRRKLGLHVHNILLKSKCEFCPENHPAALDFDHIDRSTKIDTIADMVKKGISLEKINEEIEKCRIICSNCHRKHTAKQLGWYENY